MNNESVSISRSFGNMNESDVPPFSVEVHGQSLLPVALYTSRSHRARLPKEAIRNTSIYVDVVRTIGCQVEIKQVT